jgi:hypothetical protein
VLTTTERAAGKIRFSYRTGKPRLGQAPPRNKGSRPSRKTTRPLSMPATSVAPRWIPKSNRGASRGHPLSTTEPGIRGGSVPIRLIK